MEQKNIKILKILGASLIGSMAITTGVSTAVIAAQMTKKFKFKKLEAKDDGYWRLTMNNNISNITINHDSSGKVYYHFSYNYMFFKFDGSSFTSVLTCQNGQTLSLFLHKTDNIWNATILE